MANSPRLAELADLITRREYNYAMCKARKHEEDLVRRYCLDHNMEYTTLADTIEELYSAGIIGDVSRENLHGIRVIGNKAVHEGDDDANDAKSSYDMLKRELMTYSDQKYTNPVRTPVAVPRNTEAEEYGVRRRQRAAEEDREETGEIDMGYVGNGRRSGSSERRGSSQGRNGGNGKKKAKSGDSVLYTVLRILIPVLIIILVVVLVLSLFPKKEVPEETTAVETESIEETEETTEEPTTEETTTEEPTTEAPTNWQTKGEGVRFRFASDPSQIYTTVNPGTFIGPITDYENTSGNTDYDNFARFTYDGKELIVRKDLIEEVSSN